MKNPLLTLKLSVAAAALALFVLGWALAARREAGRVTGQDSPAQIIIIAPNDTAIPPRIRTRTS